jgi:hypothetical protein
MLRLRKFALRAGLGLFLLWALLMYYPVRTQLYRLAILITFAGVLACLILILRRHRILRWLPIAFPAIMLVFFILPGRPSDPAVLRRAYVAALHRYLGVRYVWGGENRFGVDCSGLLRAALIDAHIREALRTLNPQLARDACALWWHDNSARDLLQGAHGLTTPLAQTHPQSLKDTPNNTLLPGDFAVTADGSHVLAYAGQGRWIEADPYILKTIEIDPQTDPNWQITKVVPCRWRCLESSP